MVKRVLIAVGGTGGHIYPALAFAKKLKKTAPWVNLMFAGGGLRKSRYFDRGEFPYDEISCGYFSLRKPLMFFKSLGKILSGTWKSRSIIKKFKPDLIVGFGSYHSLPLLLAAKMRSVPFILHEANALPGRVNRLFAKHALFTGIQFSGAAQYLSGKTIAVEAPLRDELRRAKGNRKEAFDYFRFKEDLPVLLVFGGSQGAVAINQLIVQAATRYPNGFEKIQVIHFTGCLQEAGHVSRSYQALGAVHFVKDFEKEVGLAWAIADLFVGRAGAGTLAEAIEFEVPSILIPYPHAKDGHQEVNARFVAEEIGAAILCREAEATPQRIVNEIFSLLQKEPERLLKMKQAIKNYKENVQHQDLSSLVADCIPQ